MAKKKVDIKNLSNEELVSAHGKSSKKMMGSLVGAGVGSLLAILGVVSAAAKISFILGLVLGGVGAVLTFLGAGAAIYESSKCNNIIQEVWNRGDECVALLNSKEIKKEKSTTVALDEKNEIEIKSAQEKPFKPQKGKSNKSIKKVDDVNERV